MDLKPNAKSLDAESQKLLGPWGVKEEPKVMFCWARVEVDDSNRSKGKRRGAILYFGLALISHIWWQPYASLGISESSGLTLRVEWSPETLWKSCKSSMVMYWGQHYFFSRLEVEKLRYNFPVITLFYVVMTPLNPHHPDQVLHDTGATKLAP